MNIKDKKLAPYEIRHDGSSYTVVEPTGKVDKRGNEVVKVHAYCSTMPNAINKIIRLKVESNDNTHDLKTYMENLNHVSTEIKEIFNAYKA